MVVLAIIALGAGSTSGAAVFGGAALSSTVGLGVSVFYIYVLRDAEVQHWMMMRSLNHPTDT